MSSSGAGEGVDGILAGRREHAGVGFLHAFAQTGLVAQARQFVADQAAVVGEQVEHLAHILERGRVAPGVVEAVGERELHARRAHQHHAIHPPGVADGGGQGQRPAVGIADQVDLLQAQRVDEIDQVLDPGVQRVLHARRPLRVAEAQHVRRQHAHFLRQHRKRQAPVGEGAHAGA